MDNPPENPSSHLPSEQEERKHPDVLPLHQAVIREQEDPRDGFAPTPVWLLFLCFALVGGGGAYLAQFNGGWSSGVYDEDPRSRYGPPEKPKPVDPMVLGARTFNNCTQCHQADAMGVPGEFPPLAGSEWIRGRPEVIIRILLRGANGPIHVKGSLFNGEMPSWAKLSDEQIAGVLTYVRASFGNHQSAVDPAMVAGIRKETEAHAQPFQEAELKAVEAALPQVVSPMPATTPAHAVPK